MHNGAMSSTVSDRPRMCIRPLGISDRPRMCLMPSGTSVGLSSSHRAQTKSIIGCESPHRQGSVLGARALKGIVD